MLHLRKYIFIIIILCSVTNNLSLSCRKKCKKEREECSKVVCPGSFHLDVCGCCKVCSKQETQECGGTWDEFGRCEVGLRCVRNPGDTFQFPGNCRPIVNGCYYFTHRGAQLASYSTKLRLEDNTPCICKSRGSWKCKVDTERRVWYDSMEIPYSGDNS